MTLHQYFIVSQLLDNDHRSFEVKQLGKISQFLTNSNKDLNFNSALEYPKYIAKKLIKSRFYHVV